MTIRGPLYTNPPVPYWNVGFVNGDNSVFIVRPGKPPAATNYYWPLTPNIREVRNYTFSEIPARIPPPNKPFNTTDWPLPVQPTRIDATWIGIGIHAGVQKPFAQTDWPNPTPPIRIEQTWIHTPQTIPPPNKPFNQTDWPNPTPLPYFDRSFISDYTSNTTAPANSGYPFNQRDWPLPTQPNKLDNQTWLETGNSFPPFPVQGFNQYDWPNPLPIYDQGLTWIQTGYPGGIPPPNQPFNVYDWPVPVYPPRIDATWIETGNSYYIPPGNPSYQHDWPLPVQPSRIDQTWIFPHTLIVPATPIPPGSNYDWPNPREFRDYRSWTWTEYPGNIPPPNRPFNQTDWPVPIGYPRLDETYVWYFPEVNLAIPFRQSDWPLPGRYQTPDGTWIHVQQITPFVQVPFNQYDWPVPKASQPIDATWLGQGIEQVVVVPLPFNQHDWQIYQPIRPALDTPPPNLALYFAPPPPIIIITGGQKWKDAVLDWKKDSDAKIKEAAAHMSSLGGKARAESLTSKQRSAIASKAASTRWKR